MCSIGRCCGRESCAVSPPACQSGRADLAHPAFIRSHSADGPTPCRRVFGLGALFEHRREDQTLLDVGNRTHDAVVQLLLRQVHGRGRLQHQRLPLGLRVDLNGTAGKMILTWSAVNGNNGYLLQQAIVVNGVVGPWELIEVGGKPTLTLNGMTVGVEYAFRVAAIGGSSGMSDWSTVVMRTAA